MWARRRPAITALLGLVALVTAWDSAGCSGSGVGRCSRRRRAGVGAGQDPGRARRETSLRRPYESRPAILGGLSRCRDASRTCNFRPTKVASTAGVSNGSTGSGSCPPGTSRSRRICLVSTASRTAMTASDSPPPARMGWSRSGTLRHGGRPSSSRRKKRGNHEHRLQPRWRALASASFDRTVRLWDAATGREIRRLEGHSGHVNRVVFSPDGRRLASAGDDRTARLSSTESGREIRTLKGHDNPVNCVAFSPDGKRLASASWEDAVKLWDATTGQEIRTLKSHPQPFQFVAFDPDGEQLACAGPFGSLKLLDAGTGQEVRKFEGHSNDVGSVAFSPDGRQLASAGHDATVKVWDIATGREIGTLKGHAGVVGAALSAPTGRASRLAVGMRRLRSGMPRPGRKRPR